MGAAKRDPKDDDRAYIDFWRRESASARARSTLPEQRRRGCHRAVCRVPSAGNWRGARVPNLLRESLRKHTRTRPPTQGYTCLLTCWSPGPLSHRLVGPVLPDARVSSPRACYQRRRVITTCRLARDVRTGTDVYTIIVIYLTILISVQQRRRALPTHCSSTVRSRCSSGLRETDPKERATFT